jgi:hypothetical protein
MSMMGTLRILLRPAAVFALRRGMKLQDIVEALRSVLIESASEELKTSGEKASTSRISVMTGLQRKVVTQIMAAPKGDVRPNTVLSKVIGQWRGDSRFSRKGQPLPLTCEGTQSEFFELVQVITRDISPYAILFELERLGAVRREDGKLVLQSTAYDARKDLEDGWRIWSTDAETLMNAVDENISKGKQVPNLHISTRYDNVVLEELPAIRRWILDQGAEFHARVRDYVSRFDKDLNPSLYDKAGGGNVSIGSFSFASEPHVDKENENENAA